MNYKAVDETLAHLQQVDFPAEATSAIELPPTVSDKAPDFVKDVISEMIDHPVAVERNVEPGFGGNGLDLVVMYDDISYCQSQIDPNSPASFLHLLPSGPLDTFAGPDGTSPSSPLQ